MLPTKPYLDLDLELDWNEHHSYIWRGVSMEGNLRFKIEWVSLIVGRKFTVFALFYFVFEGNYQVQAPGGLIFGGAI